MSSPAAAGKLKGPAICLIVVAIRWILFGLFIIIANLSMEQEPFEFGGQVVEPNPVMAMIFWLVVVICNGVIIFGSVQMLRMSADPLAMAASIMSLVPCLSPCCLLGIPFGIWALVVLMNSDVKASFR